ncbi:MAG: O-antigen ligase family protein [Gammaproteobacteria bacterium]
MTDVVSVAFVLWLGSYAGGYLLTLGIGKPLYAYVGLCAAASMYVVVQGAMQGSVAVLRDRWLRRLLLWLLGYVVYGVFTFLESSQSAVAVQALITLCELALMGAAFAVFMYHPRRLMHAGAALALLAVFAAAMNIFDFVVPTFSGVPGRGAGLYMNANTSGSVVAMAMVCGIEYVPRRLRWAFVLACGAGIVVTFSRSSWLLWGLAVAWIGWHRPGRSARSRWTVGALGALLGVWFLLAIFSGELGGLLAGTSFVRYLDPNTLARLGVGASSLSGFAADQRMNAALYAIHAFLQAPVLGHGIGYIYEWRFPVGPHDMYLRFMAEGGLVGLFWYLALMWLLWASSTGLDRLLAMQVVLAGFFSHNMLEQPAVVLILVFLVVRSAITRRARSPTAFWTSTA